MFMRLVLVLLLLVVVPGSMLAQTGEDALSLLERVTKRYRDAESVHLEATVITESHNEYKDETRRSVQSAYIASGERFRYEGRAELGSGLIVSDGTTEWRFSHSFAEFTKAPAGTFFGRRSYIWGDDRSMVDASHLIQGVTFLDANIKAAHYLPPETIEVPGRKVKCAVVHFGAEDTTQKPSQGDAISETSIWIDPASLAVVKQRTVSQGKLFYGSIAPPFPRTTDFITTVIYSFTEIDFRPDPSTFLFHAPAGSTQVAKLPSPFTGDDTSSDRDSQAAEKKHADAFVGKLLPPIILHDAEGAAAPISRYQGHPLLIDVWATWCAPCLQELPALQKIRMSTSQSDLAIIAIDEDYKSADSVEFLKRRGYDWPDFHYSHDLAKELGVEATPVTILTDAKGKIVYYHAGAGDAKGLAAAIAGLGETYQKVLID